MVGSSFVRAGNSQQIRGVRLPSISDTVTHLGDPRNIRYLTFQRCFTLPTSWKSNVKAGIVICLLGSYRGKYLPRPSSCASIDTAVIAHSPAAFCQTHLAGRSGGVNSASRRRATVGLAHFGQLQVRSIIETSNLCTLMYSLRLYGKLNFYASGAANFLQVEWDTRLCSAGELKAVERVYITEEPSQI